jgi:hypothetical protein
MNTNQRRGAASPGTGIASLLLIAVILCLTAFGVLAFVSARADLKLTDANAQTVKSYYAARGTAQKALAQLDELLLEKQSVGGDYATGALAAALSLPNGEENTDGTVSYTFPLSEETALAVTVRLEPTGADTRYTVLSEQIVESGVREETLDLWSGN